MRVAQTRELLATQDGDRPQLTDWGLQKDRRALAGSDSAATPQIWIRRTRLDVPESNASKSGREGFVALVKRDNLRARSLPVSRAVSADLCSSHGFDPSR
jgi:hypothetical protein